MKLAPFGNGVVVEIIKAEDRTAGGILLPERHDTGYRMARVLAIGPGLPTMHGRVEMPSVGDLILCNERGINVRHDGKQCILILVDDILGKLHD